ncbi:hypothetical protein POM88_002820 [Heracleum sosnowskyi]|uniref:Uncharacterized protein n=1 Tax=Heracleum sosnowskyi TaxID=360622 RepID=A0AAD8N6B7_9APIA|nr:hypothetical protein POM88_002820 [Heracleum sosnowskyi]
MSQEGASSYKRNCEIQYRNNIQVDLRLSYVSQGTRKSSIRLCYVACTIDEGIISRLPATFCIYPSCALHSFSCNQVCIFILRSKKVITVLIGGHFAEVCIYFVLCFESFGDKSQPTILAILVAKDAQVIVKLQSRNKFKFPDLFIISLSGCLWDSEPLGQI